MLVVLLDLAFCPSPEGSIQLRGEPWVKIFLYFLMARFLYHFFSLKVFAVTVAVC